MYISKQLTISQTRPTVADINPNEILFYPFTVSVNQAWILTPGIAKCPAKNWVMSDESCFRPDTVVIDFIILRSIR